MNLRMGRQPEAFAGDVSPIVVQTSQIVAGVVVLPL